MKTTILTSFVAIALFAARRSFAVAVRSQVNFSGLAVQGPSLPQQSDAPLSYQAKRHLAATSAMVQQDDAEKDVTDAQILNFPLSELYKHGLSRCLRLKEDFKKTGYPAWVPGRFKQIKDIFLSLRVVPGPALVPDFRPFGV